MNERIHELGGDALFKAAKAFNLLPIGHTETWDRMYREKFAELIVQEVIYDCMNTVRGENVIRVSMVAKHWGVEV
jgi:hypothetical protein